MKTLEQPGHLRRRYSDACVGDGHDRVGVVVADLDGDGAFEGVLQHVGQEIEHHLLPHFAVQIDRPVQRRTVHGEGRPRPGQSRSEKTLASSAVRPGRSAGSSGPGPAWIREKSSSVLTSLVSRSPLRR